MDIKTCFVGVTVDFHYPEDIAEFNLLLEKFQDENFVNKEKLDNNIFGEKTEFGRLIVMDEVCDLADRSNEFGNFLTISRKFGYICVYIFRIRVPSKSNWQTIFSQTKIFNIFPSSLQIVKMLKILTNNCDRQTINYIPLRDLWINHLYFSISKEHKNSCLTIDCRYSVPAKYRTNADNDFEQFCYYRQEKETDSIIRLLLKQ